MSDDKKKYPNYPERPYNEMKFDEFLKTIGSGNIKNWSILAEAMGVTRKTIYTWRQHPLAQEAINTAISESLKGMQESGKDDWRMHREMTKILGVKDRSTIEHEAGEGVTELLDALQSDYGKLGQEARRQVVEAQPSLQNPE